MSAVLELSIIDSNSDIENIIAKCAPYHDLELTTLSNTEFLNQPDSIHTDILFINATQAIQAKAYHKVLIDWHADETVLVIVCSAKDKSQFTAIADFIITTPIRIQEIEKQLGNLIALKYKAMKSNAEIHRLEKIINHFQDGVWEWDLRTNETQYSPQFYTLAGYEPYEFPQTFEAFKKRVHPNDWNKVYDKATEFLNGKIPQYETEFRFQHKDKSWMWLLCRCLLLEKDKNQKPIRFIGTHTDISHLKQTQDNLQNVQTFYQTLIEQAPDGIALMHPDGTIKFTSPAVQRLFGYTSDKTGQNANDFTHPDDLDKINETLQKLYDAPLEKQTLQYRIKDINGEWKWLESTFSNFLDNPIIDAIIVNFRDISIQHAATVAMEESSRKLNTLINNLNGVVYRCLFDENWTMEFISKGIFQLSGYPYQDFLYNKHRAFNDLIHPDDQQYVWDTIQQAQKDRKSFTMEYRIQHADGTIRWVWERGSVIIEDNITVALEGFIADITEQRIAENALVENEKKWMNYVKSAPYGVITLDEKGNFIDVNPAAAQITGHVQEKLAKMNIAKLVHKDDRQTLKTHLDKVQKRESAGNDMQILLDHNEKRWLRLDTVKLSADKNLGFMTDITDRKNNEFEIAQKNKMLALLNEFSIELSQLKDKEKIYRCITKKVKQISGAMGVTLGIYNPQEKTLTTHYIETESKTLSTFNRLLGENIYKVPCPIMPEMYTRLKQKKIDFSNDLYNVSFGGIPRPIARLCQDALKMDRFIGIAYFVDGEFFGTSLLVLYKDQADPPQDILETFSSMAALALRRLRVEKENAALEEQLLHAQKMESIGRLAGGVAHDFNNMLQAILGHTEMALDSNDELDIRNDLQEIQNAAVRSAELTRQLLAFARKQTVLPQVLNLNTIITGMLKMLRRLIGEEIELHFHPQEDLWKIKMDPVQIDQILANLCINAKDAIEQNGQIILSTQNTLLDKSNEIVNREIDSNEYVQLTVRDNGCGIDAKTQKHLFEPFFTTKKLGQGTGLGLATVYGIVKQNNGFINVKSSPNKGAEFSIFIPRELGNDSKKVVARKKINNEQKNKNILLVEDEPAILNMVDEMLTRLGYTVFAAATASQAEKIALKIKDLALLMTDVVMPETNGKELAEKIIKINPNTQCVFMSGYPENAISEQGMLESGMHYIQKPFSLQQIAELLEALLMDNSEKHS